jgi:protoporphyrin/coproporphyrin ferrochelatase
MKPIDHPAIPPAKIGVLLINLGTPDAAEPKAVRRYLKQFLSDRRVVEIPPLIWQPILRGAVLTTRPKKSAHAYAQVWTEHGSPLAAITRAQAKALADRLAGDDVLVDYAMRYGNPSIGDRLEAMKAAGCERILTAVLYPQYCAATTATANDNAFVALAGMRWQPALRTLPPYYDDPKYIEALAASVRAEIAKLSFQPEVIVASFHGMPARTLALGDPYYCHCQKTGRLLGEALGRPVTITFQSRFGKAKWFDPATDTTLEQLARSGTRSVAIVAPGFSADCIETLEELALRGRDSFKAAGGEDFAYLPCLNTSDDGIDLLEHLVRRELSGWLPAHA